MVLRRFFERRSFHWTGAGVALLLLIGAAPVSAQIPDEFTNLQVLPKDMGKRELVGVMRSFAGALGVRCSHCHPGPDNLEGMDFATDKLEPKQVARAMMKMTSHINDELLPTTGRKAPTSVRCLTCHRGLSHPESLNDLLEGVIAEQGVDAAIERYGTLREEYYGQGAYDFGPGTLNGLAEDLARQKDLDGAVKLLQLNVEANPDAGYSYVMLGQVYAQMGETDKAVQAVERALELEPDNDFYKRMLGRLKGGAN